MFWMPIAPPRLPALQRFVETGFIRWMLRVVPLFGVLISHSFIVRGTKPFRPSATAHAAMMPRLGNVLVRILAGAMSPEGRRARLSILIYHRVLAKDDPLNTWDVTAGCSKRRCA